jgi:hypothetical protein
MYAQCLQYPKFVVLTWKYLSGNEIESICPLLSIGYTYFRVMVWELMLNYFKDQLCGLLR